MRYLRLFENHNTLFTIIDLSEFNSKTLDTSPYTNSELSFISDSLKEISRKYSLELTCEISKDRKNVELPHTLDIIYFDPTQQKTFLMSFTKGYDKWFYSFDWMRYCKCDDLEGIVSCIDERVDRLIPHLAAARIIHQAHEKAKNYNDIKKSLTKKL
jgi:hypothetical protein